MLTIGQLAAYAGVTVRTVRHYHQIGLLPEPERDASGYRRYGATAAVSLIKIRTLANAGVPLSRIEQLLEADAATFTAAIRRIDSHLRDEIERLETSRRQIAELAAGDGLTLPPEVTAYLDRLREIGASERVVAGERDGWILVGARWPDSVREFMPGKLAQLDDPRIVRLYRVLSEILDGDADDDPRLAEAADIMAGLAEQAHAAGELDISNEAYDEMPHDLLDALAVESDPRIQRLRELLRERGWTGWNRMERLAEPPPVDLRLGAGYPRRRRVVGRLPGCVSMPGVCGSTSPPAVRSRANRCCCCTASRSTRVSGTAYCRPCTRQVCAATR
ncbi:hypothetical protein GCM10029963_63070 [Micromonospora andamanensis]